MDTKVSFLTLLPFQGADNLSLCTFIISFCPQKERSPRESVPRVKCYPLFIRASFGRYNAVFVGLREEGRNPLFIRASFGRSRGQYTDFPLISRNPLFIRASFGLKHTIASKFVSAGRNPLFIRASFGQIIYEATRLEAQWS